MSEQRRPGRYPAEMRDRAVRLVFEAEQHSDSQWEAICSVAEGPGGTQERLCRVRSRIPILMAGSSAQPPRATSNPTPTSM
jgi:hypothetical protein